MSRPISSPALGFESNHGTTRRIEREAEPSCATDGPMGIPWDSVPPFLLPYIGITTGGAPWNDSMGRLLTGAANAEDAIVAAAHRNLVPGPEQQKRLDQPLRRRQRDVHHDVDWVAGERQDPEHNPVQHFVEPREQ